VNDTALARVEISFGRHAMSGSKTSKAFIIFFLVLFFFAVPYVSRAQAADWSWFFKGGNFNLNDISNNNASPAVAASDESNGIFLVVWMKQGTNGFDIYGARVDQKGVNLEVNGEFAICTAINDQVFPSVSWNGETFLVVWQDGRSGIRSDIFGARVTLQGIVLDPNGFQIFVGVKNLNQALPAVSFDGTNHLVVWQGRKSGNANNIFFARVTAEGTVIDSSPVPVASSSTDQSYPAVDFDGSNYLVVWSEKINNSNWGIMGARVTPQGDVLDADPVQFNSITPSGKIRKLILSWNGESHLVGWMVSFKIGRWSLYGKRVGPNLEILDLTDINIESDGFKKAYLYPAIAWDGSDYLLVWEELDGGRFFGISGASVNTEGQSIEISGPVLVSFSEETTHSSYPALATIGETALVVWDGNALPNGYLQVFGQILSKTK